MALSTIIPGTDVHIFLPQYSVGIVNLADVTYSNWTDVVYRNTSSYVFVTYTVTYSTITTNTQYVSSIPNFYYWSPSWAAFDIDAHIHLYSTPSNTGLGQDLLYRIIPTLFYSR